MSGSLLEIERLRVVLPVGRELRTVLHEVSLAVGEGEAVGLVGASGSGKTMTARAAVRLLPRGGRGRGRRCASRSRECPGPGPQASCCATGRARSG